MVSLDDIKKLRSITSAGMMDCKSALEESGGNIEKAIEILRKKGIAKASKKEGNELGDGVVESYIHDGGRLGVLVELGCQTDFVARNDEFKKLAREIAIHIAASNPLYISRDTVPDDVLEKEKEIARESLKNEKKPQEIVERIVESKIDKFFEENCLMEQRFFRDESVVVGDLIKEYIAKFGENIKVIRFARFQVK